MFNFLKNIFKKEIPEVKENEETKREVRSDVEADSARLAETIKELREVKKSTEEVREEVKKERGEVERLKGEMVKENEETKREVRKMASSSSSGSTHYRGHQIVI